MIDGLLFIARDEAAVLSSERASAKSGQYRDQASEDQADVARCDQSSRMHLEQSRFDDDPAFDPAGRPAAWRAAETHSDGAERPWYAQGAEGVGYRLRFRSRA